VTGRVFSLKFAWQMSRDQADTAAAALAYAATARFGAASLVIGIANGGIQPATTIANSLGVPLACVRARHNATGDIGVQATGNVWCQLTDLAPGLVHGTVLVVDDIYGTGATLDAVTSALGELAVPGTRLHTITLCRNAGGQGRPCLTIWDDLREWVVFPWEAEPIDGTVLRPLPAPGEVHAA
jgi:uncharacterized protein